MYTLQFLIGTEYILYFTTKILNAGKSVNINIKSFIYSFIKKKKRVTLYSFKSIAVTPTPHGGGKEPPIVLAQSGSRHNCQAKKKKVLFCCLHCGLPVATCDIFWSKLGVCLRIWFMPQNLAKKGQWPATLENRKPRRSHRNGPSVRYS